MRAALKRIVDALAALFVLLPAATCWVERRIDADSEGVFSLWAQTFAFVPGPPGVVVRRAFYRLTLEKCARSFYMAFGALFTHRHATVEQGVYIGAYTLVGCARLGEGCLIGSRASVVSGSNLHTYEGGRWSETDLSRRQQIEIGAHAWIGEGAIVIADVGAGAMVAAGSVVSMPVVEGVMVGGNPARFISRLHTAESATLDTPLAQASR